MTNDAINDLIREIAAQHGVAVDRDDPILILQTATRIIVQDALRQAQQDAELTLARHRSELELASAKWQQDSKRTAAEFLQHVPTAMAANVGAELNKAASSAVSQLEQAIERHEKALVGTAWVGVGCLCATNRWSLDPANLGSAPHGVVPSPCKSGGPFRLQIQPVAGPIDVQTGIR